MIDFHNHILPGIDEGSKNMEETIKLIQEAKEVGFDKIIFTPHYKENFYEVKVPEKEKIFNAVCENVKKDKLDIELFLGNEVYMASDDIEEMLNDSKISTINNTKYLLFELPFNSMPLNLYDMIYEIQRWKMTPILAHPERYSFVQTNPELVYDLVERGVLMQQNYGSILGQYGKRAQIIAKNMLQANLVHFLGSDVHRVDSVYKNVSKSLSKIESLIGEEKFSILQNKKVLLVLENKKIDIDTPQEIKLSFKDNIKMKLKV